MARRRESRPPAAKAVLRASSLRGWKWRSVWSSPSSSSSAPNLPKRSCNVPDVPERILHAAAAVAPVFVLDRVDHPRAAVDRSLERIVDIRDMDVEMQRGAAELMRRTDMAFRDALLEVRRSRAAQHHVRVADGDLHVAHVPIRLNLAVQLPGPENLLVEIGGGFRAFEIHERHDCGGCLGGRLAFQRALPLIRHSRYLDPLMGCDVPDIAEGIRHTARAIAVRLVARRIHRLRSCAERAAVSG